MRTSHHPHAIILFISLLPAIIHGFLAPCRTRTSVTGQSREASSLRMSASSGSYKPNVLIVGGGFGGLYSALRLSELAKPSPLAKPAFDITLVDRNDRFVFLPLLYELAVGDARKDEVAPTFRSLLASTGIRFVQGQVEKIDPTSRSVSLKPLGDTADNLEPGDDFINQLSYDKLVIALGSEPSASPSIPQAMDYAMPFHRLQDAEVLSQRLAVIDARTSKSLYRIIIVGGGYSGVELATNLAARLGRDKGAVTLVDRGFSVLHNSPDHIRAAANKRLTEEGVEVILGVDVLDVTNERVVIKDRSQLPTDEAPDTVLAADLVIWTAGASVNPILKDLESPFIQKDGRGRLLTDGCLRAKASKGDIYVLGDNAAVEGYDNLPSTAQVAFQQSEVAAWNIWSSLTPNSPGPLLFRYTALGEMLTLGPIDGTISGLRGLLKLDGPSASLARRLVYVMRMPTGKQRLQAAKSWVNGTIEKVKGVVKEGVESTSRRLQGGR